MIKSDREYSVTRYWRDTFHTASLHAEGNETDGVSDKMWYFLRKSYRSQSITLQEEMDEYLRKTGKHDSDFPYWEPPDRHPL